MKIQDVAKQLKGGGKYCVTLHDGSKIISNCKFVSSKVGCWVELNVPIDPRPIDIKSIVKVRE